MIKVTEEQLPNVKAGMKMYRRYVHKAPYLADDLFSEMLYAVHYANLQLLINKAENKTDAEKNVESYVKYTVRGYLGNLICKSSVLGVSRNTYIKKGGEVRQREYLFTNDPQIEDKNAKNIYDLLELIDSCYENDREREVIPLIMARYTYEEAGAKLGISHQRVQQIVSNFARKVKCKLMNGDASSMKLIRTSRKKEPSCVQ